jgi:hypothetical protein
MVGEDACAGTADFVLLYSGVLGVNSCARPRSADPYSAVRVLPMYQLKYSTNESIFSWWARRDSNPQGLFSQRILSPPRIPIPPLALEARTGNAPVYWVLQTHA